MKIKKCSIIGITMLLIVTGLSGFAIAADDEATVTTTEGDYFEENISGFPGEIVSTLVWVVIGLLLILGVVGIVDVVTDKMKHNWLNLEELAGNPTAMAIIAAGLMVSVSIIIHASLV